MLTVTGNDTTALDSGVYPFTLTVSSPNFPAVNAVVYNFQLDLKTFCPQTIFVPQVLPSIELFVQDKKRVINQLFNSFMYDTLLNKNFDCGKVEYILTVSKNVMPPFWASLSAVNHMITLDLS